VFRSEIQKKELDLARVKDANYDLTEERHLNLLFSINFMV